MEAPRYPRSGCPPNPRTLGVMHSRAFPCFVALSLAAQGAYAPRVDLEEGRYLQALAAAEAQLKANPGNALAWSAKAHALSALLRLPEAIAAAEKALVLDSGLADAYLARGLARGGQAVQQRNFGSLRKASGAMDDLRRATELDPGLGMAWTSLGLAYQQLPGLLGGSTRRALKCAEALRRVQPARADALQGLILSLDERWGEAEPYFGRALALAPADPQVVSAYLEALGSRETRQSLGAQAQRAREVAEARRLLPAVRTRAKGVEAASDALLDAGHGEEAWQVALQALPHVEAPSILHLHLGKIAAKAGIHREEGLAFLDLAIRGPLEGGTGGPASAWWRKGQILKDLGRLPAAREAATRAEAMDPKHPGIKRLLEGLP